MWSRAVQEDGSLYFFNEATQESAWSLPEGAILAEGLPHPWSEAKAEDGETYYYNAETGVTCWELPAAVVVSALPLTKLELLSFPVANSLHPLTNLACNRCAKSSQLCHVLSPESSLLASSNPRCLLQTISFCVR
jgi:hypothetical protein